MKNSTFLQTVILAGALFAPAAHADELSATDAQAQESASFVKRTGQFTGQLLGRAGESVSKIGDGVSRLGGGLGDGVSKLGDGVANLLDGALDLVGIRYRRGGTSEETGFDCSGFVGYVFKEKLGLLLPRTSREISKVGEEVPKSELEPGDLVFFKTMRQTFSHVGIYLGNNQFVHAPRTGQSIRVEDMRQSYWARRYNGARRIEG
jgi:cell wall-associated NlpC family hydrolase